MRILVVEDSPTQAASLRQRLEGMGHHVTTLPSAVQALELLSRDRYPVVMTDWIMPVMDGPTFCRRVRSELQDGPYVFIIMMTSKDLRHERLEGLESGADVFLTKPFDNVEIGVALGTIGRLLASQEAPRRIEELDGGRSPAVESGLDRRSEFVRATAKCLADSASLGAPVSVRLRLDPLEEREDVGSAARALVDLARLELRPGDTVARLSTRDLAWLLPDRDRSDARDLASRILKIASIELPATGAAAGVAGWEPGRPPTTPDRLLADSARAVARAIGSGTSRPLHHDEPSETELLAT